MGDPAPDPVSTVHRFPLDRVKRWTGSTYPIPIEPVETPACTMELTHEVDAAIEALVKAAWAHDAAKTRTANRLVGIRVVNLLRGALMEARAAWERRV